MLTEVVVYLDDKYTKHISIWVRPEDLIKEKITEIVNKKLGTQGWWSYDIL